MQDKWESNQTTYVISPEEGAEMARLIDQDRTITEAIGSLFPPELDLLPVRRLLDVACGPGGWARDVARQMPDVEVTGLDISEQMIRYARAYAQIEHLENADFLIGDVTKGIALPDESFDLVNARGMLGFLHKSMWPNVIKEFARLTQPGGFVVLTETDDFGHSNSEAFERYQAYILQGVAKAGLSQHPLGTHWGAAAMLKVHLRAAGYQNVRIASHILDYSAGTQANGSIYKNFSISHKLIQPFLLRMGISTQKELDELYEQCFADMQEENFSALWSFVTAWGSKAGEV
jgi:ubiquinone/menaquinone biosynthesis C-methylase UbiE